MGSLLGKFENGPRREILMLGLDSAGKTTILIKTKSFKTVAATNATVGFNVEQVQPCKGVRFTLWDMGGQDKLRHLWHHYYARSEGLIFVVDSNDRERVAEAREELSRVLEDASMTEVPLVVVANKQDLPMALSPEELVDKLGLQELGRTRDWTIQGAVGVTGEGIYDSMQTMAKFAKAFAKRKKSRNL